MERSEILPENDDHMMSCEDRHWGCFEQCEVHEYGLIRQSDVRGLLHCHTAYGTGDHDLNEVVEIGRKLGLEYLGVTDHVCCVQNPEGLDPACLELQRREIELLNARHDDIQLLHGVEVEAADDGRLPLPDEILSRFDYVVATLRKAEGLSPQELTDRAVRAVMHPFVSVLGHPIGKHMTSPDPLPLDLETVLRAAAKAGVAVHVDANPPHEKLDMGFCHLAQELGAVLVISSDAHRAARLGDYRHGTVLTQLAGVCCRQVLNSLDLAGVRAFFERSHTGS